jgi:hypothetical protein
VLIFETHPLLTPWLTYHARHNDVYFDGRFVSDAAVPQVDPFLEAPDLASVDFVATRDQVLDLRAPRVACLTFIDDTPGEDRRDGHQRYWIGPPVALRFLAVRPITANLNMRIGPGPDATSLPIDYFLADDKGHVSQGEIRGKNVDVRRIDIPRGVSTLRLTVKGEEVDPNTEPLFPVLAELDKVEISDIK